jgi:hypothetical protein
VIKNLHIEIVEEIEIYLVRIIADVHYEFSIEMDPLQFLMK